MLISVASDPTTGMEKVTVYHHDPSTGNRVHAEFVTNQVVSVEVVDGSKVMLHGSRSHGNKIQGDFRGDAWITTAHNRVGENSGS